MSNNKAELVNEFAPKKGRIKAGSISKETSHHLIHDEGNGCS